MLRASKLLALQRCSHNTGKLILKHLYNRFKKSKRLRFIVLINPMLLDLVMKISSRIYPFTTIPCW